MIGYNLDKHAAFVAPARDFPSATPVRLKYCILSSPRTGSTLLARALYETGLAGDPLEYLNPRTIEAWRRSRGRPPAINDYLADMIARRTSPNGVFGIKAHFRQIVAILPAARGPERHEAVAGFLRGYDRIILVQRGDRLGQSISYFRALATEVWSSEDEAFYGAKGINASKVPDFDGAAITNILSTNLRSEIQARKAAKESGIPFIEVTYEALVDRYEQTIRQALAFLGVVDASAFVPKPPTSKLADAENARFRQAYLEFIGAGPG